MAQLLGMGGKYVPLEMVDAHVAQIITALHATYIATRRQHVMGMEHALHLDIANAQAILQGAIATPVRMVTSARRVRQDAPARRLVAAMEHAGLAERAFAQPGILEQIVACGATHYRTAMGTENATGKACVLVIRTIMVQHVTFFAILYSRAMAEDLAPSLGYVNAGKIFSRRVWKFSLALVPASPDLQTCLWILCTPALAR